MKVIELLNKSHDRSGFDCEQESLNQYLQQIARQHISKGLSRTFVLVDKSEPQVIIGFFTLTLCEVLCSQLPPELAKKYPSKVPGVKLARLAVDKLWQRQGIGEILMIDAMKKALALSDYAGGIGLFVDALNDSAKTYYERYGFVSLVDRPREMFLPFSTIRQLSQQ